MSPETQQLISKALSLIEQSRFRMGTSRFVEAFIDRWAYLQTGLYPAKEEIPAELQPVAFELSHVLSVAMKRDPTSDVLGYVLSMSGFHKKGTNYFPTPPEIGRLMSLIIGSQSSANFYLITHDPQPASRADMASAGLPRLHAPIQQTYS
ncbi:hypothetical protein KAM462_37860 [Aeromonas caviae]|nr:hypothetical protein KAM462_37860 [Aeromonas caviae]